MQTIDIQGHRGARGLLPENSLPAFQLALDLGVTTLEMDTVISKDRQVVLSHDPYFSPDICLLPDGARIPGGKEADYQLFDLTYDEIRSFDCGSLGNPRFPTQRSTPVRKPLLDELIGFAESYAFKIGRAAPHYNIETKSTKDGDGVLHPEPNEFASLLLDVIRARNIIERTIVQSFDVRTLQVVKSTQPALRTALLVSRNEDRGIDANLAQLGFVPSIYSPDKDLVDQKLVDQCHQHEMALVPWTVNDAGKMRDLVLQGVDGIITDFPDVAMGLVQKGWSE